MSSLNAFTNFSVCKTLHDILTVSVKLDPYTNQIFKDFNFQYAKIVFFINTWKKASDYLQNNNTNDQTTIVENFSKLLDEFTLSVQTDSVRDIKNLLLLSPDSFNLHVLKMTYSLYLIINNNIVSKLPINFLNEDFKTGVLFYAIENYIVQFLNEYRVIRDPNELIKILTNKIDIVTTEILYYVNETIENPVYPKQIPIKV